jgi:hypothetical protein
VVVTCKLKRLKVDDCHCRVSDLFLLTLYKDWPASFAKFKLQTPRSVEADDHTLVLLYTIMIVG